MSEKFSRLKKLRTKSLERKKSFLKVIGDVITLPLEQAQKGSRHLLFGEYKKLFFPFAKNFLTSSVILLFMVFIFWVGCKYVPHFCWLVFVFSLVGYAMVSMVLVHKSLSTSSRKTFFEDFENLGGEGGLSQYVSNLLLLPLLWGALFLMSCFSSSFIFEDVFVVGDRKGFIDWLGYLVDNVFRSVVFDFAEVYRFDLSDIAHSADVLVCTHVFVFRSLASVTFVSFIIQIGLGIRGRIEAERIGGNGHPPGSIFSEAPMNIYLDKEKCSLTILYDVPLRGKLLRLEFVPRLRELIFVFDDVVKLFGVQVQNRISEFLDENGIDEVTLIEIDQKTANPVIEVTVPLVIHSHSMPRKFG